MCAGEWDEDEERTSGLDVDMFRYAARAFIETRYQLH